MRLASFSIAIASALFLMGCAAGPSYKAYDGPDRPKEEIAILDWTGECCNFVDVREIDGFAHPKFNAGLCCGGIYRAELTPGKHTIRWAAFIHRVGHWAELDVIEFKAGHVYSVETDSCSLCFPHKKGAAWIEDITTGEVVAGSKELRTNNP